MGFIRLNRKLFDHIFWRENRVYSRAEAWIDLIQLVSFTRHNEKMIDGVLITWNRGEYPISHRFLSMRWNWSVHKVRIFMKLLALTKQTATRMAGRATILTLCNYDYYNPESQDEGQDEGQAEGKQRAQSIRIKEDKEVKYKEEILKEEKSEGLDYKIDPVKEKEIEDFREKLLSGKFDDVPEVYPKGFYK